MCDSPNTTFALKLTRGVIILYAENNSLLETIPMNTVHLNLIYTLEDVIQ